MLSATTVGIGISFSDALTTWDSSGVEPVTTDGILWWAICPSAGRSGGTSLFADGTLGNRHSGVLASNRE
ncbi:hypothetical protein FOMPIDRAFT_92880 [Fomitopsis schrenkii]|uniref:Uncharacterized protein n=1 Tax=Fomitopsis schrenkii TaxID=2126942 RepID=S8DRZ0_FOMSC|nr:hypothetical protein FOMPIDRAFT_92880 [Fomitopsis schrenkii]